MSEDFTNSLKDSLLHKKGPRKKYRDLYNEQLAERAGEHKILSEAFKDTVKTMNGMAQLASQQVKQITDLSEQIIRMKAEAPNGDSEETEDKGE